MGKPTVGRVLGFAWGVSALALGVAGCDENEPSTPANGAAVEDVCGREPAGMSGDLSDEAKEDIELFVSSGGSDATRRHVTNALGAQSLPCDALSFATCRTAVLKGAPAGLALELNRMALATTACKSGVPAPAPVATTPTPSPTAQPAAPVNVPEWPPGKYMAQALDLVVSAAQRVQKTTNYSFDSTGTAVLGTFLTQGQRIDLTRTLDGGVKYALIGGGSEGAADLDVAVYDSAGKALAVDVATDNKPVIEFTPPSDGRYKLELALPESERSGAFAAITLMRVGGYTVPMDHLVNSFGDALARARMASAKVAERDGIAGLVFQADGDWSAYGIVLKQGEGMTFNGLELGKTEGAVILAGTDGGAEDVDLEVIDMASKAVVVADREDDPNPLVVVKPERGHIYSVKVTATRASKPSLVSVLVLRVQPE